MEDEAYLWEDHIRPREEHAYTCTSEEKAHLCEVTACLSDLEKFNTAKISIRGSRLEALQASAHDKSYKGCLLDGPEAL